MLCIRCNAARCCGTALTRWKLNGFDVIRLTSFNIIIHIRQHVCCMMYECVLYAVAVGHGYDSPHLREYMYSVRRTVVLYAPRYHIYFPNFPFDKRSPSRTRSYIDFSIKTHVLCAREPSSAEHTAHWQNIYLTLNGHATWSSSFIKVSIWLYHNNAHTTRIHTHSCQCHMTVIVCWGFADGMKEHHTALTINVFHVLIHTP